MASYYDEQGNEVEGLLTEDDLASRVEAERSALAEKYEAEKAEAHERVGAIESEKARLEEQIAETKGGQGDGASDKETNLANLRKKLDEAARALEEERSLNQQRFASLESDKVEQVIAEYAQGDEELAKKIRFNYSNVLTGLNATSQQEIKQKVANAFKLSTDLGSVTPDPLSVAIAGGSRGVPAGQKTGDSKKFSQSEVAVGGMLGISDQDRAKYSNDPRLK